MIWFLQIDPYKIFRAYLRLILFFRQWYKIFPTSNPRTHFILGLSLLKTSSKINLKNDSSFSSKSKNRQNKSLFAAQRAVPNAESEYFDLWHIALHFKLIRHFKINILHVIISFQESAWKSMFHFDDPCRPPLHTSFSRQYISWHPIYIFNYNGLVG